MAHSAIKSWAFWRGQLLAWAVGAGLGWWVLPFIESEVNSDLLAYVGGVSGLSAIMAYLVRAQERLLKTDVINFHAHRNLKEAIDELIDEGVWRTAFAFGFGGIALAVGTLLGSVVLIHHYQLLLAIGYGALVGAFVNVLFLLWIRRWMHGLEVEITNLEEEDRRRKERNISPPQHLEEIHF